MDKSEAFGLVQLESMAEGTPVIVSDLPGVNSVAHNGMGVVVKPGDVSELFSALVEVLKVPLLVTERVELRRFVAEHYSDEVVGEHLAKIIGEV